VKTNACLALLLVALSAPALGGCVVTSVAGAAVGVGAATVGAAAKVTGAAVGVTVDAAGAAGHAVLGGGKQQR
jgi:hypothetical protein